MFCSMYSTRWYGDWFSKSCQTTQKHSLAFPNLRHLCSKRDFRGWIKDLVFPKVICSILLYSCETCSMELKDIRKLQGFNYTCLWEIIRVPWNEQVNNAEVRHKLLEKGNKSDDEVVQFCWVRWLWNGLRMLSHWTHWRSVMVGVGVS